MYMYEKDTKCLSMCLCMCVCVCVCVKEITYCSWFNPVGPTYMQLYPCVSQFSESVYHRLHMHMYMYIVNVHVHMYV